MEYSRDLTNLDLGERGDEEGESVGELGSSLFVCVTRTYMILFKMKSICDNVKHDILSYNPVIRKEIERWQNSKKHG